ncbi:MAG: hypothetical protein B7Z44_17620, partial [Caulobacter sp. 12-67-6]
MDGSSPATAPFRDARYAPRALDVEQRGDALILRNPMPYSDAVQTVTAPLARWAVDIEAHYGRPMDMEWADPHRRQ